MVVSRAPIQSVSIPALPRFATVVYYAPIRNRRPTARAVKLATERWNKQVFVATHSPVLISQFEPRDILVAAVEDGRARFERLSEIDEIRDLLEDYAAGSLYMSEAIAGQRPQRLKEGNR